MQTMLVFLSQAVPEGRLFALDEQTLIGIVIQLINGIILAVALGYILYKPVKNFMAKRTERIQGEIANSDETMAKAKELIAEYESKVANIDKEYDKVLEEARVEATKKRQVIIAEANEEAGRIKERAEGIIETEKERLRLETRPYIIELATLIAENYITDHIEKEEQDKLFDEALAELEEAQWQ